MEKDRRKLIKIKQTRKEKEFQVSMRIIKPMISQMILVYKIGKYWNMLVSYFQQYNAFAIY